MATKNTGSHNRGSHGSKASARSSRKARKPVTIDLEPTKVVSASVAAQKADSEKKTADTKSASPMGKSAAAVPTVNSNPAKSTAESGKKPDISSAEAKGKPETIKADVAKTPQAKPTNKSAPKPAQSSGRNTASSSAIGKSNGGSTSGKLLAGVIGGAVALVGAYLLQQTGLISSANTNGVELKSEIIRIDATLKGLADKQKDAAGTDVSALLARIAELENLQKTTANNLEGQRKLIEENSTTASGLAGSVEQAAKTSERLQQFISSGSAGENVALSILDERLKALEAKIAGIAIADSGEGSDEIAALKIQLGELAGQIAQLSSVEVPDSESALKENTTSIAGLAAKLVELANNAGDGQAAVAAKISEIGNSIVKVKENLSGLGARLDSVEAIATTPQKDEQRVARALAVAGLKSAIDSGGNFESALTLVESLGQSMEAAALLKPFAASGVPTIAALESQFGDLADKITATGAPSESEDMMGKLFANMRSLVKVKSTGVMAGDSLLAITSRIIDGLTNSDLGSVVKEWETLPDTAKAVSDDWFGSVKARQSANELINNLLNKFITGTSGTGN